MPGSRVEYGVERGLQDKTHHTYLHKFSYRVERASDVNGLRVACHVPNTGAVRACKGVKIVVYATEMLTSPSHKPFNFASGGTIGSHARHGSEIHKSANGCLRASRLLNRPAARCRKNHDARSVSFCSFNTPPERRRVTRSFATRLFLWTSMHVNQRIRTPIGE